MNVTAVVLDADGLICIALVALLKKILPNVDVTPVSSVDDLLSLKELRGKKIDLLISNIKVGSRSGTKLLTSLSSIPTNNRLFYYEEIASDPSSSDIILLSGFHLISLNAPLSVWAKTVSNLLPKSADGSSPGVSKPH